MERYFTLEEANALLPRVVTLVEAIQASHLQLANIQADVTRLYQRSRSNGKEHPDDRFEQLRSRQDTAQARLRAELEELRELGCVIKDPSTGLIDFPSLRDGRVVYLCWKLGEPEVSFWHEVDHGFAGRRPLE